MRRALTVMGLVFAACGPTAGTNRAQDPGDGIANAVDPPPVNDDRPSGEYRFIQAPPPNYEDEVSDPIAKQLFARRATPSAVDARLIATATHYDENDENMVPPEGDPIPLDLDGDGDVDMVVVSYVFFGPSMGWGVYVRRDDRFEMLFSYPGVFSSYQTEGDYIAIRYEVMILAGGEPIIQQGLFYSLSRKQWVVGPSLYRAAQTEIPENVDAPRPFELAGSAVARTEPTIDDTPIVRDEYGDPVTHVMEFGDKAGAHEDYEETSATLYGNAIAVFEPGAAGVVLAERGQWAFVAFHPDPPPREVSLHHGIDYTYDAETDTSGSDPQMPPSYCGWIETGALRR